MVYGILGTSRQLSVGPEALVSILVGSSIREFRKWRDPEPEVVEFIFGSNAVDIGRYDNRLLICHRNL